MDSAEDIVVNLRGPPVLERQAPSPSVDREGFTGYLSRLAAVPFCVAFGAGRFRLRAVGRLGLLDRRPLEVPPFRPGAVVTTDVGVAEEILQDEPRVKRPVADPAVGDDLFIPAMPDPPAWREWQKVYAVG